MFDKKYIAGIASFAGAAINNVKAVTATGDVTIIIGDKSYKNTGSKIDDNAKKTPEDVLAEIAKLKNILQLDGTGATIDLTNAINEYFIKEIKEIDNSPSANIKFDITACSCGIATTKPISIELVKKSDKINIKYSDTVKGGRLTKENEEKILKSILQGKKNNEINGTISLNNLEFNFGGKDEKDSAVIFGKGVDLFANNDEIDFEITKLPDIGFKTVVCTFDGDVEKKLVSGVDLEKLCEAAEITKEGKKLSEEISALNEVVVKDTSKGIFKSDANLDILANGVGGTKLVEASKDIPDACKFILINNIKEENINPIFLKKNFIVEFDNENDNTKKVDPNILDKIIKALNKEFTDKVVISVKNITDKISTVVNSKANDIIINNAFSDLSKISIEGVNSSTPGNLGNGDTVNAAEIKIKLKAGVFAADVVKTEIKLTCDLDNVKKDDKKLKEEVKSIILGVLNTPLDKVTPISDIITKLNTALAGKFENDSKKIETTDIDFTVVSTDNTNITKSGKITINGTFANKLIDDCFESEKEQVDDGQNKTSEASKGTNGDSGSGDGNKDQKGCCGSNKK